MKPSDYYFCLDHNDPMSAMFSFTSKEYWNENKVLDDCLGHIDDLPKGFSNSMEACWEFHRTGISDINKLKTIGYEQLIDAGFLHSEDMSDFINSDRDSHNAKIDFENIFDFEKVDDNGHLYTASELIFGIDCSGDKPVFAICPRAYWNYHRCLFDCIGDETIVELPDGFFGIMEANWEYDGHMEDGKRKLEDMGMTYCHDISEILIDDNGFKD